MISEINKDVRNIMGNALNCQIFTDQYDYNMQFIDYIESINRVIPSRDFETEFSSELTASHHFSEFQTAIQTIKSSFESGTTNRPYHSRGILTPDRPDLLLNDWGIYHFHLGEIIEADGFIERTEPVLFLKVNGSRVYFLDILVHGQANPDVCVDEHLIRILKNNWPEYVEKFKMRGMIGNQMFTAHERKGLRKHGASSPISLDGELYIAPGLGLASSGTASRFVARAGKVLNKIHKYETYLKNQETIEFIDGVILNDITVNPVLRLEETKAYLRLYEGNTGRDFGYINLFCG